MRNKKLRGRVRSARPLRYVFFCNVFANNFYIYIYIAASCTANFEFPFGRISTRNLAGYLFVELARKTRVNDMARDPCYANVHFADASIVW